LKNPDDKTEPADDSDGEYRREDDGQEQKSE